MSLADELGVELRAAFGAGGAYQHGAIQGAKEYKPSDPVDHPAHYRSGGIESIDVIEAFGLGFCLGNVLKYVLRAGRKGDALTDLKKARWYLDREIARIQQP